MLDIIDEMNRSRSVKLPDGGRQNWRKSNGYRLNRRYLIIESAQNTKDFDHLTNLEPQV